VRKLKRHVTRQHTVPLLHNVSFQLTGIAVGNHRSQVIDLVAGFLTAEEELRPLLILPPVVMELGPHELIDLVGHRVHGIVGKVGTGLVRRRRRRRALPSRHVDAGQVGGHLDGLDGIEGAERVGVSSARVERREEGMQLVGLGRAEGRLGTGVAVAAGLRRWAEGRHVQGRVGPGGVLPPAGLPPLVDLGGLLAEAGQLGRRRWLRLAPPGG
jgi:hypothetical protein